MIIGGLVRFSLNDFPGRVAAVIFTQGCNFRCPFCHNGALLPAEPEPGTQITEAQVMQFLRARGDQLDGVVISGGEPTLQPDLPDFLQGIRELGLATKLDTNGSRPDMLGLLLSRRLLDFVAMDIKAPLESYARLAGVRVPAASICESIGLIVKSGIAYEFRTTFVEPLLTTTDVQRIVGMLPAGSRHRLQKFQREHALDPALRGRPTIKRIAAKAG